MISPKIIPSAANVATKLFLWKDPTKIRNSPIKLLVPGKRILAKVRLTAEQLQRPDQLQIPIVSLVDSNISNRLQKLIW